MILKNVVLLKLNKNYLLLRIRRLIMKTKRDLLLEKYAKGEITAMDLIDMIIEKEGNNIKVPPSPPPSTLKPRVVQEGFGGFFDIFKINRE